MYYLAINNGLEGWSLSEHNDLTAIAAYIQQGNVHSEFKLFKELELVIVEPKEG